MSFNITDFNNKWVNFKKELQDYINRAIDKDGDTMTGRLLLAHTPSENMEAATKEYVDDKWNFIPGDTIIKQSPVVSIYISNSPISIASNGFPYNVPMRNNSQEDTSKIIVCSNPRADGFVRFSGELTPMLIEYIRFSSNNIELSAQYDFEMSYSVKYCREGYNDMLLYESPVFSAYDILSNDNHPLRHQILEHVLPVSKGVDGIIKLETIIHSTNVSGFSSSYKIYLSKPKFGFAISIGNPMFTL